VPSNTAPQTINTAGTAADQPSKSKPVEIATGIFSRGLVHDRERICQISSVQNGVPLFPKPSEHIYGC
jgi:hypothetical protein